MRTPALTLLHRATPASRAPFVGRMGVRVAHVALLATCAVAGCSRSGPERPVPGAPAALAASPCDRRLVTREDVAGILSAPIEAIKGTPGDAQSCSFETAGFPSITVSVRPGVGRETVDTWLGGRMPLRATTLPGVGDSAAWQSDLRELVAQRNNVLCDVQAAGAIRDFAGDTSELPKRLGALCDTIFTRLTAAAKG